MVLNSIKHCNYSKHLSNTSYNTENVNTSKTLCDNYYYYSYFIVIECFPIRL